MKSTATAKQPLITVCIPTYNHEKFIAEAVESVFSQSVENLLVIVADDKSQDNTVKILRQFKKKYGSRLVLVENRKNIGLELNFEKLHDYIPENTKYLAWFSGDDIMLPGKLSAQMEFMEQNPEYVMCYHDSLHRNDKTKTGYRFPGHNFHGVLSGRKAYSGNIAGKFLQYGQFLAAISVFVNYEKTKHIKYNADFGLYNDWAYSIELALEGKVGYISRVLSISRLHGGNVTSHRIDIEGTIGILEFFRQKHPEYSKEITIGLIRHHLGFAWKFFLEKNFPEFRNHTGLALKHAFSGYYFIFPFITIIMSFFIRRTFLFFRTGSIIFR